MRVTVPGRLVALVDRSYDFVNDDGERVAGQTRQLYVATAMSEPPALLNVPTRGETPEDKAAVAEFEKLLGSSPAQFAEVSCIVDVSNKGKFTFRSVTVAK